MPTPYVYMSPAGEDDELILVEIECRENGCLGSAEFTVCTLLELNNGVIHDLQNGVIYQLIEEECE